MKQSCKKCKSDCEKKGTYIKEGEDTYYFCNFCFNLIKDMPTGNIKTFLQKDGHELVKNKISKDMLLARIKRGKGKSTFII